VITPRFPTNWRVVGGGHAVCPSAWISGRPRPAWPARRRRRAIGAGFAAIWSLPERREGALGIFEVCRSAGSPDRQPGDGAGDISSGGAPRRVAARRARRLRANAPSPASLLASPTTLTHGTSADVAAIRVAASARRRASFIRHRHRVARLKVPWRHATERDSRP
jgi:hypothetical protein